MFGKMKKFVPVLMLGVLFGGAVLVAQAGDASARTTQCWKCTGGWCCY